MRNYAAITIGPIIETISNVSTPGALWCASGMFSNLASDLCERILDSIPDAIIVSPAYQKGFECKDGIGRWHDRIFFHCQLNTDELYEKLKQITNQAKEQLAHNVCKAIESEGVKEAEEYIRKYIQINWLTAPESVAEADGKNCILNLSKYLDSAELSSGFSSDESGSPLTKLFVGKKDAGNYYIKNCWLIPEGEKIQLKDEQNNIRDIESVANPERMTDKKKIRSYFAVVQSDGDGMGKCLESCTSAEDVAEFSRACIKYTEEAAKLIGEYGGLTVYAGGDDLLFLAPLESYREENILTLCKKITGAFSKHFREFSEKSGCPPPTLSFGVSINYTSAPLYEAVKEVVPLLMCDAKSDTKNKIALSVHKHSGQSVKFVVPNRWEENTPLCELEKLVRKNTAAAKDTDEILKSVLYALDTFSVSYELCRSQKIDTQNFFENTFDNVGQAGGKEYIDFVKRFGDVIAADGTCKASDNSSENKGTLIDKETQILNSMLRFAKLYYERGEEQ